ncbi:MAG: type VI secretion system accessory protein TagJ [Lacipirellulaceae bacterium]
MAAVDALRSGDLTQALAQLRDDVRARPEDSRLRVFLFQLLAVTGDWERALAQLGVAAELDPAATMMAKAYREIVRCEALRQEVFQGKRSPVVFGEPEPWVAQLVEALRLEASGETSAASDLRSQAFEAAPTTAGTILNASVAVADPDAPGDAFEWIADGDGRLGPILEVVVNGRYCWAPMHRIAEVSFDPPTDLRDLVWAPAHFRWSNEGETVGVVPTRYPGSESSPDDAIRLGRRTDWTELADGGYRGLGQRSFVTDKGEFALLETRRLRLRG